jgi:hypothetical protein
MDLNIFKNSLSNPLARKQKTKVFLIFILISFLFWGITKFSKNYSALVFFDVKYVNTPDLIVVESSYKIIEGYINTSGFQLLLYRLIPKKIKVDISLANFKESKGILDLTSQRRSLDDQISGSFLSFENDQLVFNYSKLTNKKVKVSVNTDFIYSLGYNNMNDARVEPDSVYVSGPESIINNLNFISTILIKKENISNNIKTIVSLENKDSLVKIRPNKVLFQESIKRFTEKDFEIFINLINVPDSIEIKLFPEKVKLTASFPIDLIEKVKKENFELVFDYLSTENGKFESVPINLINTPEFSRNVRWIPKTISYLIKK